jgi:hypothetical protein
VEPTYFDLKYVQISLVLSIDYMRAIFGFKRISYTFLASIAEPRGLFDIYSICQIGLAALRCLFLLLEGAKVVYSREFYLYKELTVYKLISFETSPQNDYLKFCPANFDVQI